jgi:hypothetical protein
MDETAEDLEEQISDEEYLKMPFTEEEKKELETSMCANDLLTELMPGIFDEAALDGRDWRVSNAEVLEEDEEDRDAGYYITLKDLNYTGKGVKIMQYALNGAGIEAFEEWREKNEQTDG